MRIKKPKEKGKIQFSRYFRKYNEGDIVAVVREPSCKCNFPDRIQGRTGIIDGKRGKVYLVKINDFKKEKQYLIEPIHLKKIKQIEKQNDKKE
jgi:ribosomal protein L21E